MNKGNTIKERLIVIEHVLTGNGSEGLFGMIKEIKEEQKRQSEDIKRLYKYLYVSVGAIGLFAFVSEIILKYVIK